MERIISKLVRKRALQVIAADEKTHIFEACY